jgi:lipoprotein NlpD
MTFAPCPRASGPTAVQTRIFGPDWCRRIALAALVLVVAGCASRTRAPVEERTPVPLAPAPAATSATPSPMPGAGPASAAMTYTVKRGDTLFQIALDNGLDYRELAGWNGIENPNVIHAGQVLRLAPPGDVLPGAGSSGVVTAPLRTVPPPVPEARSGAVASGPASPHNADNYKSSPKAVKERYSDTAVRDVTRAATAAPEVVAAATPAPPLAAPVERVEPATQVPRAVAPATADTEGDDKVDWIWPAKGKVVAPYSDTANLKGIDIAGTAGEPVVASAAGKVVYAGTGLRGYGKLVIVKHNKTWLSAYAHNKDILVKEGQLVTKGQKIAEMGNTDSDQVKLHFEIRRLGKPVDPTRYLPAG